MNIKIEKTFIDAWQTDIDDAICTKIMKNMSLTMTFVSVKSSTKKKNIAFYMNINIFQEDRHKLRAHACVQNNENDDNYSKWFNWMNENLRIV